MCGTGAVSIPQPAPHPLRTPCLGSPHYTYAVFLTSIIEGREHKELEPEKCHRIYVLQITVLTLPTDFQMMVI
jgi:hypothetical protein